MNFGTNKLYPFFVILLILSFSLTSQNFSQSWNAIGSGTNGVINSSIVFNGDLIIAGAFSTPASNIARWTGSSWTSVGSGTNDTIYSLAIYNSQLIAAGSFTIAGGVTCNRIARWNGSSWAALGLGANNTIHAAAFIGAYLRAGGRFTTIGGIAANRIARWDGSNWSIMGTGTNDNVYAMTQFGNDLILGGAFTSAGGVAANRIVRFNLTSGAYTALGSGVDNNAVLSLRVFSNNLYVGGNFTAIGGVTVNNIARWTGTNWNTVGSGTNGPVKSMFPSGTSSIYIGGSFTTAGGTSANNIASFNGSVFSALGTGITGGTPSVNSIETWSNVLVASGLFTTAGAVLVPASNVAGWGSLPAAPALISPLDGATGISTAPLLVWSSVTNASTYGVQIARDPNFLNIVINIGSLAIPQYQVPSGTPLLNNITYFWRANARNGLGTGPFSLVRFFTTALVGIINTQEIPLKFNLYQNYPNPFNPVTKIMFDLPSVNGDAIVKLIIFNISGEKVADLVNTDYIAGKWEMDFDGKNLASGVYLYKIEAGPYVQTNKMILIK